MNYYPHHIGDFNNATRHLNRLERSIYRDLLELYYDTEGPLTHDIGKLSRRIIATTDQELIIMEQILGEYFVLKDDFYHNARCDIEIEKYRSKADTARANGKLGGRPKKGEETQSVILANPEETNGVILANPEETGSKANQNQNQNQKPCNTDSDEPVSESKIPPCPTKKIIDLYNHTANHLPQSRIASGSTKSAIKARWRSSDKHQKLEFWEGYFQYCESNLFLSGRWDTKNGSGSPFRSSLDWLVNDTNFAKVINRKYQFGEG